MVLGQEEGLKLYEFQDRRSIEWSVKLRRYIIDALCAIIATHKAKIQYGDRPGRAEGEALREKINFKTILLYVLLVVFSFLAVFIGSKIATKNATMFTAQIRESTETYLVKVDNILSVNTSTASYGGVNEVT